MTTADLQRNEAVEYMSRLINALQAAEDGEGLLTSVVTQWGELNEGEVRYSSAMKTAQLGLIAAGISLQIAGMIDADNDNDPMTQAAIKVMNRRIDQMLSVFP